MYTQASFPASWVKSFFFCFFFFVFQKEHLHGNNASHEQLLKDSEPPALATDTGRMENVP